MDAVKPIEEVRSRAKSNIAFSDAVFARRRDRALDPNAEGKTAIVSPLSFTRIRAASEVSLSPPVTASTLIDESTSSFTIYEGVVEREAETKPKEDSGAGKRRFWGTKVASKTKIPTNIDEETPAEPKLSPRLILANKCSIPGLSSVKVDAKEETRGPDDKKLAGTIGGKLSRNKAGGTVRRVWRSIVGRT